MCPRPVYEAIISVYSPIDGLPHFTPVGVREISRDAFVDDCFLEARIFCTARLFAYLCKKKDCVVHFPASHQQAYFLFAFKTEMASVLDSLVEESGLSKAVLVDAPVLDGLHNFIEARVQDTCFELVDDWIAREDPRHSRRAVFKLRCMRKTREKPFKHALQRPCGEFVDFLINATRLRIIPERNQEFEIMVGALKRGIDKLRASGATKDEALLASSLFQKILHDKSVARGS